MKPIPDCIPHALEMILTTARAVSDDEFIHRKVIMKVMADLAEEGDLGQNPAEVYMMCWEIACRSLGVKDPLEKVKARGAKTALGVLQALAEKFPSTPDTAIAAGIQMSYAGIMAGFYGQGHLGREDVIARVAQIYSQAPAIDDSAALADALDKAANVVLVANRAGEVILDRPLVNALADRGKRVALALTERPVFAMATEKDVLAAGFNAAIDFITPGSQTYGLLPEKASTEFRDRFREADVIIVKGSTHFTTLQPKREFFFILRADTDSTAAALGIAMGQGAVVRRAAQAK